MGTNEMRISDPGPKYRRRSEIKVWELFRPRSIIRQLFLRYRLEKKNEM
jgi:hypothetical protein